MEHYSKGSFRNRCVIAMAGGLQSLSIPLVKGKNQQTDIREVRIDYSQNWQQLHWRTVQTAYGSAPFFDYYKATVMQFYEKKMDLLFDFCIDFQNQILKLLKLSPAIEFTSEYVVDVDAALLLDFRNKISPKSYTQAEDPHFSPAVYPQIFEDRHGFTPNLSILDLLFCAGPEASYYLKNSIK